MEKTVIPRHVGLIIDGNRRWAVSRGKPASAGHREGVKVLKKISRDFFSRGVTVVSAYVFSKENWNRSEKEVSFLMALLTKFVEDYIKDAQENNIRIVVLGGRDRLASGVLKAINNAEEQTASNTGGVLALCFNYGGRQEIVDAAKKLLEKGMSPGDLDESGITQELYKSEIVPDIDLIVRTSGEQRLSGFMTWRSTYSELIFVDKHWPDFDESDVDLVLEEYANRQRRFGK